MQTDGPPTPVQRFTALVVPALRRAGYTGHGANARLSRDTGIAEATISRMMNGKKIPDAKSFEALARVAGLSVRDMLVESGIINSRSSLSENERAQVRSQSITPTGAADELGIHDPIDREMFLAMIDRLRRRDQNRSSTDTGSGDTAVQA